MGLVCRKAANVNPYSTFTRSLIELVVENYHRFISRFSPGWDAGQTTLTDLAS